MKLRFRALRGKDGPLLNSSVCKAAGTCKDEVTVVRPWMPALIACASLLSVAPLRAQDAPLPPVTVGAGVQTSFVHDAPQGASTVDNFVLNSVRLYVNGSAATNVKFMFNTEYDGAG